jgi:hypothetical protein
MGQCAATVFLGNKTVEQLVAVVWFVFSEGDPGKVILQELFPDLFIPINGARLEAAYYRGQIDLFAIIGNEWRGGWMRLRLACGDHTLIAQSEHSEAGCRIMLCIAVAQFMRHTLLHPINGCEIAHKKLPLAW